MAGRAFTRSCTSCGALLTPLLQLKEAKHRQRHHLALNTELALFSKFLAGGASCVVPVESLLQQPLALPAPPALVLGKPALGSPTFVKTSPSLSALHSTGL